MDKPISYIQIVHLVLEGATMALTLQLIASCLHNSKPQRWKIRTLKIIMAVGLFTKSLLFSSFNLSTTYKTCQITGRTGNAFFHMGDIASIVILLLRVMALVPNRCYIFFIILHTIIFVARLIFAVFDVMSTNIFVNSFGVCMFKEKYKLVAGYTVADSIIDVYVSIMVASILINHILKVRSLGISGNITLYVSIVATNVIRTTILSIVNIICAVYLLVDVHNPIIVFILWPVTSICLLVLVGYDTDITNAMRRIKSNSEHNQNNDQKHYTAKNSLTCDFSSIPHSTREIVHTRTNNELGFNDEDLEMLQESSSRGQRESVRPEPIQQDIYRLEDYSQGDPSVSHSTVTNMTGPSNDENTSESLKTY